MAVAIDDHFASPLVGAMLWEACRRGKLVPGRLAF